MRRILFSFSVFFYIVLHAETQVLVIHSYSEAYPWSAGQYKGFREVLEHDKALYPSYSTEYLDTKRRAFDKAYQDEIVHYMSAKYKGYEPKLIYTTDDDAFNFMLHNKEKLFPSARLVFSGVNDLSKRNLIITRRISGVFEEKDVASNVLLVKTLFPNEKEIVLLGDNSTTGNILDKQFIDELKISGIKIHSIIGNCFEDTLQELKSHKLKIVILTTIGGFKTKEGRLVPLKQVLEGIKKSGDFTLFALEDTYLQDDVIGGYLNRAEKQGKEAGRIALEILNNTSSEFSQTVLGKHDWVFDLQALDKRDINLPEDIAQKSRFINRSKSFAHKYAKALVFAIYALIVILITGSLFFAIYMYRSRKLILTEAEKLAVMTESMEKAQEIAHIGHWDWDIQNNTLCWSNEIYRIFGLEPQEFEATYEAFISRVHPDDRDKVNEAVNFTLEHKSEYHVIHRIIQKEGTQRHVLEEGVLKLDEAGTPARMIGIVHDITEKFEREESILFQSEVLNIVQDSIMVHDLEGNFIYINENAYKTRGYTQEEMLKISIRELDAPEYTNANSDEMKKLLQKMKDEGYVTFEVEHLCKNGERLPVEIYSKLITLNEKQYVLSSVRDITQQKKAKEIIAASEKKYRDLVENSMVGIYRTTLAGEIIYVNPAFLQMFSYDSLDELKNSNIRRMYDSPQEREKLIAEIQKKGCLTNYELTARDKNNKAFPVMLSALLEGSTLTGMVINISELKESQAEIEKLSKVVEQIDDSVAITDKKGNITYANQAFYNLSGYSKDEVIGKKLNLLKSGRHTMKFYEDLWKTISKGGVFRETMINKKKNGELFYEKKTITPLKDDRNNITGYVSSGKDVTAEAMMQQEIEHIASTDILTGIYNRYKFEELFMLELERAQRFQTPLSLILIDIDHFKVVNDSCGHDVGDEVLKCLVEIVQKHIRKIDIFARWGGEEFLVLAPNTDLKDVYTLAEKLRKTVESSKFPVVQNITISIGVSQLEKNDSFNQLFKRADQALYFAKDNGRNQVAPLIP